MLILRKDILVLNIVNMIDKFLNKITQFRDQLHHRNCYFSYTKGNNSQGHMVTIIELEKDILVLNIVTKKVHKVVIKITGLKDQTPSKMVSFHEHRTKLLKA